MDVFRYYGRFQNFRGSLGGLPGWARGILVILAIPGIVLIALSLLALAVSILALLLLTVPVYRLLSGLCSIAPSPSAEGASPRMQTEVTDFVDAEVVEATDRPKRNIEVKIVE